MPRIDLKKELKEFYGASARHPVRVNVPGMNFLMIDGQGDPNTADDYRRAVEALYSVAYTVKFGVRNGPLGIDYGVMPLEGLWWTDDMRQFRTDNKDIWKWTLMILQPEWVSVDTVRAAKETAGSRKVLPALPRLRLERFEEGEAAQLLHVGSYAEEGPTVERLHAFIADGGHELRGRHHEIYLNDARRTAPSRLKTIIRQPFA